MVEIDEKVVEISKKYFPNLANSYNDERLKLFKNRSVGLTKTLIH